ncbi:MAG: hypothetical protein ACREBC_11385 [Pyrinomonadaceae bacterium]
MRTSTIDHLGDVVDGVELILKVSQRVAGLCMCQPRKSVEPVVLRGRDNAIWQRAGSQLVRRIVRKRGIIIETSLKPRERQSKKS